MGRDGGVVIEGRRDSFDGEGVVMASALDLRFGVGEGATGNAVDFCNTGVSPIHKRNQFTKESLTTNLGRGRGFSFPLVNRFIIVMFVERKTRL